MLIGGSEGVYEKLLQVAIPAKTQSYQPVPHKELVVALKEKLDKHNLTISTERYSSNAEGTQMFGCFSLQGENGGQEMSLGFRNSYDKSLAVGLVCGSNVIVCSNLMFKGDIKILRKHTAGVFTDLSRVTESALSQMEVTFNGILKDSDALKNIELTKRQMAELAGRLFIEEELINSTQLNIIKKEIDFSQNFKELTMWDFYNHCTEGLKKSMPGTAMNNLLNLHNWAQERLVEFS